MCFSNVDGSCLDSKGASIGILIMWDWRVLEKVEEFVGEFLPSRLLFF